MKFKYPMLEGDPKGGHKVYGISEGQLGNKLSHFYLNNLKTQSTNGYRVKNSPQAGASQCKKTPQT